MALTFYRITVWMHVGFYVLAVFLSDFRCSSRAKVGQLCGQLLGAR